MKRKEKKRKKNIKKRDFFLFFNNIPTYFKISIMNKTILCFEKLLLKV